MANLFFGMEVFCPFPWEPKSRHLTLAFLGKDNMPDLSSFPKPPFSIGVAGMFDKPLILKHVVAWHVHFFEKTVIDYQQKLAHFLGIKPNFLPHVTVKRKPCDEIPFQSLPLYLNNINLYESLGFSQNKILWQYQLLPPFEEIEHTADMAFIIRGNLFLHAQLALAFHFPPFLRYFDLREIQDRAEMVTALNRVLAKVDSEIGCPFKAVSFHGVGEKSDEWEMIVDV